jgi:hypothetical protein
MFAEMRAITCLQETDYTQVLESLVATPRFKKVLACQLRISEYTCPKRYLYPGMGFAFARNCVGILEELIE